jgi:hypothetical protein
VETSNAKHKSSEARLLAGLDRLLSGKPVYSDGRLTKTNVAKEARVSLATLNRCERLHQAWDDHVKNAVPVNPAVAALEAKLSELRKKNRALQAQRRVLERQLETAKTVISQIYLLNLELSGPDPTVSMKPPFPR